MYRDYEEGRKIAQYRTIDEMREDYPVLQLCKLFNVSKSGYYAYLERKEKTDSHQEQTLKAAIMRIYEESNRTYGYRRIQAELEREGWIINHKKVFSRMKELGIQSRIRKKPAWLKNQYQAPVGHLIARNILDQNFYAECLDQLWVTDVTEMKTLGDKLYLSVIMDLYNNEIIAYSINDRNDWNLVKETLMMAREKKEDVQDTILHSDRGSLYTSYDYHEYLEDWQVKPSMSKAGDCFDNACVESFFSHLKTESLYLHDRCSWRETQKIIEDYIERYNNNRLQLKLNKLTPVEYRDQLAS